MWYWLDYRWYIILSWWSQTKKRYLYRYLILNLKRKLLIGYLVLLFLIPLVLLVLPANFFDSGQSVCVSVLLFDQECYGCGMTRAIQHMMHFDFSAAYEFNKLSIIVLPLLIFIWIMEVLKIKKKLRKNKTTKEK